VRRLLLAAFLALVFHALLFRLELGRAREENNRPITPDPITITLAHKKIPTSMMDQCPPEVVLPKNEPAPPPKVTEKKPPTLKARKKTLSRYEKNIQILQKEEQAGSAEEEPPGQPEPHEEVALIPRTQIQSNQGMEQPPDARPVAFASIREAIPAYRANPSPEYPAVARRRGYEGTVLVEVLVNREGRVEDLRLSQSSGYPVLDQAAMTSMRGWLFEPATINEKKVEMWVKVPVRFHLK
jgi:protein TonB